MGSKYTVHNIREHNNLPNVIMWVCQLMANLDGSVIMDKNVRQGVPIEVARAIAWECMEFTLQFALDDEVFEGMHAIGHDVQITDLMNIQWAAWAGITNTAKDLLMSRGGDDNDDEDK